MTQSRLSFALLLVLLASTPVIGQERRALDHADYDRWNRIQNDTMSKDGRWLAYRLVPGDGDATLMVRALRGTSSIEIPRGSAPAFSGDSRYLVATIQPTEEARDQARASGRRGSAAPKDSLAVVDLSDMSVTKVADVTSVRMPADAGGWIAYLLASTDSEDSEDEEAAEAEETEEGEDDGVDAPRLDDGAPLVVHMLPGGEEGRFDHVVDYRFSADGSALYFTASGEDGAADGVFRVSEEGAAVAVATGEGRFVQLAVSDDGTAAFLSDREDRASEAPAFALFTAGDGDAVARVMPGSEALPAGWAPSEHGAISFSDSGRRVFFGTASAPRPPVESDVPENERVSIDIWNWKDPFLQPMQLVQLERERERTYEAMLDLRTGTVVQLATVEVPTVSVGRDGDGAVALGTSDVPYRQLVSWDGRYVDLYLIDIASGERRRIVEQVRNGGQLSPDEDYVTVWDGFELAWYAIDVDTGARRELTRQLDVAFHDLLDDHPDALRPYGAAGWSEDDEWFLVYDQFDIWAIDPTGEASPRNVTEGVGRENGLRFRYLDTDREEPTVPLGSSVFLTSFDLTTKAAGIYRDRLGDRNRPPAQLLQADARFAGVRKAENADVVTFTRSTFEEFPDLWVTDLDFNAPTKVTDANPQQAEYLWGSAELVQWNSNDGVPLQGILYKPDGFDPTQQYPMMVYFYERSSDGLHQHFVPAPGSSSIDRSFYVSRGYLLFVPDIPYRIGYPGESAIDAVVPGVLELVDQGFVDRERIGIQGHSWGGYQIAYMITRTDLFAAAEAGAPVANMISAYGGIRWSSGMSRAFQYERTQSRIGGSIWERPLRYIENSPIFTADKIRTPLLMLHNDEDGAVPWYQGIELFVALRRLGQPVWMLNYNGEDHGLRQPHNRKDWAIRMQQFFDHYLMGAPAPVWMEEGVPATLKGETLGLDLTDGRIISEDAPSGE